MAIAAWVSVEIPGLAIIPVCPGERTPVTLPPSLAILGEPVPTTMVVLTKRRTSKPFTKILGTVVTLGWKGCFIATGGCPTR